MASRPSWLNRSYIVVGDITDHNGQVLTGSATVKSAGRNIARAGDSVSCPIHGENRILATGNHALLEGQEVAYEGTLTECGSRLIPLQAFPPLGSELHRYYFPDDYWYYKNHPEMYEQTPPGQRLSNPNGSILRLPLNNQE